MKKEVRRKVSSLPGKRRLVGRGPRENAALRKRIEERASRSERQLATAQQITHMGSWEWDVGKNQVSWSDELYRIYGLLPRSCEITLEGFLARVHPDDRGRIQSSVSHAVETRGPFRYRERIVRADGSIRELDTAGEANFDEMGRFCGLIGTCRDVTEERARERLEAGVHRILEMMASAAPLAATLAALVGIIEAESDGMLASVLLYDSGADRLRVAAAPSLPEPYNLLLNDFPIGPEAGSCGTAVYLRSAVFVSDILSDALWRQYRFVASDYGLRACWSTPIFANDGRVIGTFALYYREPRRPTEQQLALIQRATHIAGIAIERNQMEEQLAELSAHLERAREDERAGIAREIHDELGQALTGLKMDLAWLGRHMEAPETEIRERIAAMSTLIDETIGQVRRISAELRPGVLDDLGLRAALEWQAQEFEKRTGTRCAFQSSVEEVVLTRDASTAVFRICQEALTNVARHADATRVDITLERQARLLYLAVVDNGKGMREGAARSLASLGLLGIRERARRLGGEVEVTTGGAGGTTVRLTVPLEREGQRSAP
jgi:signal transduction histidine kinase